MERKYNYGVSYVVEKKGRVKENVGSMDSMKAALERVESLLQNNPVGYWFRIQAKEVILEDKPEQEGVDQKAPEDAPKEKEEA